MSGTRFKYERYCTSTSDLSNPERCWLEKVPLRDWSYDPAVLLEVWRENTQIPTTKLVTVTFPELNELQEYRTYRGFRYAIVVPACPFFDVVTTENLTNITVPVNGKVQFQIRYKNFQNLTNEVNAVIKFIAYAMKDDTEHLLEERQMGITIQKEVGSDATPGSSTPTVRTDKSEYTIIYNKTKNKIQSADDIQIYLSNIEREDGYFESLNEVDYTDNLFVFERKETYPNLWISKFKEQDILRTIVQMQTGLISNQNKVALISKAFMPYRVYNSNQFTIHLHIVEDSVDDFFIDKTSFSFHLLKSENKTATGQIILSNPNNLELNITPSAILSTTVQGEDIMTIDFVSLPASQLKNGVNKGSILVKGGEKQKLISVEIEVRDLLNFTRKNSYFCLDKDELIIRKSVDEAQFVRMKYEMKMEGYGVQEHTVTQEYEYVFFQDEVSVYFGEDVQDFFTEISTLDSLNINESNIIVSKGIFKAAIVTITITEYDDKGVVYKEHLLEKLRFLPGKTPKAYPFLTNGTLRSTYSSSLISISSLVIDMKSRGLGEIGGNLVDNTNLEDDDVVGNISFRRSVADITYGALKIIQKATLTLEPKPNTQDSIDVIFQNQNFCPDWFTFSGEWQRVGELEHIISENAISGKDFKVLTKGKNTLKLNTGWIFEEEIALLEELMESTICFVKISEKWIKSIPITKKPLSYDSERNMNSQVVEFQIVEDER